METRRSSNASPSCNALSVEILCTEVAGDRLVLITKKCDIIETQSTPHLPSSPVPPWLGIITSLLSDV